MPIYAATLTLDHLLMGLILSFVFGITAGNYACSLVHRLPRGRAMLDKKPYCGNCGTLLATKDLFPLISALMLRHKCRYCGAAIPKTHFYTEALLGTLFCLCFMVFGFSEQYFLVALLGSSLAVLGSIHINDQMIEKRVFVGVVVAGLLYRTLADATLFDAFMGGLVALVLGCALFYKAIRKEAHVYVPPLPALLMAAGGLCVGLKGLVVFLPAFAALALIRLPVTVAFGFAVMAALFAPAVLG